MNSEALRQAREVTKATRFHASNLYSHIAPRQQVQHLLSSTSSFFYRILLYLSLLHHTFIPPSHLHFIVNTRPCRQAWHNKVLCPPHHIQAARQQAVANTGISSSSFPSHSFGAATGEPGETTRTICGKNITLLHDAHDHSRPAFIVCLHRRQSEWHAQTNTPTATERSPRVILETAGQD